MTTTKDLIAILKTRNPNAQVFFMTQRKQPFENHLAGVVGREEMADQQWRFEPGIAPDDVFLVVGRRIRPGSLSAWIVAERQAAAALPATEMPATDTSEPMAVALAEIARQHLQLKFLEDAGWESADLNELATCDVRRALEAAYLAGRAAAREDGIDTGAGAGIEPQAVTTTEQPQHHE